MVTLDSPLRDRAVLISGGSRGIGLAIGLNVARCGANVVLMAKTSQPHPRLPGTVHTAAAQIEESDGKALAVVGDVRKEDDIERTVSAAADRFGGIDICVNNAGVIATEPTELLSAKKFDLMHEINVRGMFLLTKACLPYLRASSHAHVLTIAPPLNMNPFWLGAHPSYTLSKYAMTLLSLGWSAEYSDTAIGFNCLWPQTYIATAAVANTPDGTSMLAASRDPQIMADAATHVLSRPPAAESGKCHIDADVLIGAGVDDLSRYGGGSDPIWDIFVDAPPSSRPTTL